MPGYTLTHLHPPFKKKIIYYIYYIIYIILLIITEAKGVGPVAQAPYAAILAKEVLSHS